MSSVYFHRNAGYYGVFNKSVFGSVFDSCCDPTADPVAAALTMNKVAKIRWAYIRLSYLLLLYFPQHRETFINLEIYPAAELRSCYVYSNALSLSQLDCWVQHPELPQV